MIVTSLSVQAFNEHFKQYQYFKQSGSDNRKVLPNNLSGDAIINFDNCFLQRKAVQR